MPFNISKNKVGTFMLLLLVIFLLIVTFVFKVHYLDFRKIILKYFESFRAKKGKILIVPFIEAFIIPIFLAFVTTLFDFVIEPDTINIITVIISILTSMFFTLLTMLIDVKYKISENKNISASDAENIFKALNEMYYSVMFEILVSILILILCFFSIFSNKYNIIISFIIFSLVFILLFNMFFVLRRAFVIIEKMIEN